MSWSWIAAGTLGHNPCDLAGANLRWCRGLTTAITMTCGSADFFDRTGYSELGRGYRCWATLHPPGKTPTMDQMRAAE